MTIRIKYYSQPTLNGILKKNKIRIQNQKFYVKIKNPNKYVIRSKLGTNITQENCILVNFLSDSIKNECENKNVCENKTKQKIIF